MKGKCGVFGVLLLAACLLGMTLAGVAKAEVQAIFMGGHLPAEHVTTIVEGAQDPEDPIVFTSSGNDVACSNASLRAEIPGGTAEQFPIEFLFEGECEAGGLPATTFINGCYLELQTAETTEEESYTGEADLICPNGPGQLKVYAGASHGFLICTISISSQEGLGGAVVHSKFGGEVADLDVTLNASGIQTSQAGLCGSSEGEGILEGSATVVGTDEEDNPVDIWIEHE